MISLLFFVNDHYRFYELKDKIRSSAYLMASMIQQISNTRSNKQISDQDITHIAYASHLNLFGTSPLFGITMKVCLFYVKKVGNDSYQYQASAMGSENIVDINRTTRTQNYSAMIAKCPSLNHPDMLIENIGDEKLLIECLYYKSSSYSKNKLGFFIISPKFGGMSRYSSYRGNFAYRIVITPKPGLFPIVSD